MSILQEHVSTGPARSAPAQTMKAIAVLPGRPDSVHLAELPRPRIEDVANGRGVLVKVLRVGVDGTDREINAAEYGAAPDGYEFLVIGHEGFGQVVEVGAAVTEVKPGDYVVATVRRPGSTLYDLIGTSDMTTTTSSLVLTTRAARSAGLSGLLFGARAGLKACATSQHK